MPLPKNVAGAKAYRKALLTGVRPPLSDQHSERSERNTAPRPLKAHPFDLARDMAYREAGGLKSYECVAPMTIAAAMSPEPQGPISIEYGPAHAIRETRGAFDVGDVMRDILRREAAHREELRQRRLDESQPRAEMGDFLDDEASYGAEPIDRFERVGGHGDDDGNASRHSKGSRRCSRDSGPKAALRIG